LHSSTEHSRANEIQTIVPIVNETIEGIDMNDLISRIGNDREKRKKYLLYFCEQYGTITSRLDTISMESEEFHNLIHTLKGASGNLSINRVYELTLAIEKSVDLEEIKILRAALIASINDVVEAIGKFYQDDQSEDINEAFSSEEIMRFIQQIIVDLEHSSVIENGRIEGLAMRLSTVCDKDVRQKTMDHLRAYQYDEALVLLKKILGSL
jgi:HPt (histidine-containing phosphotransfer) domain-containing protein